MPTYDYKCSGCGHAFELFQQMTDKLATVCPKCNSKKIKRLIGSGSGIIFKGTGFYETDYKRKESQKPGKRKDGETQVKSSESKEKKDSAAQDASKEKQAQDTSKEKPAQSSSKNSQKDAK